MIPPLKFASFVSGFDLNLSLCGWRPIFVLTFTRPVVTSPYSTDGTPVMTSTFSMLSAGIVLRSIWPPADVLVAPYDVPVPDWRLALFDIVMSSIITFVPKRAAVPSEPETSPAPLSPTFVFLESPGGAVLSTPGTSSRTSPRLVERLCSISALEISWVVSICSGRSSRLSRTLIPAIEKKMFCVGSPKTISHSYVVIFPGSTSISW